MHTFDLRGVSKGAGGREHGTQKFFLPFISSLLFKNAFDYFSSHICYIFFFVSIRSF